MKINKTHIISKKNRDKICYLKYFFTIPIKFNIKKF